MALSYTPIAGMAFAEYILFRGHSRLQLDAQNLLDARFKQSKNESFHGCYERNLLVAETCTTREAQVSVRKSSFTIPNFDEIHQVGGRFADWRSASSTLTSQWVKQLEIETIIRNLQPANAVHSSSSVQLSKTRLGGCIENTALSISRRLSNLPQSLSINGLTASRAKRSTALKVAHPGAAGAHSEAAATKAYPECESLPCGKFEVPFEAVELGLADRAVLPIENSVGGSIHKNYDLLLQHRLHIVGEVQLPVHHCLLALPGTTKKELKRVLSHPQALSQCEHNLSRLGIIPEAVNDTAAAARLVAANNLRDTGAIASARAASLYGLDIVQTDFQDYSGNTTRFLVVAREPVIPRTDKKFKTSIVISLENESEGLFRALAVFALRNINLTKLESRPQRRKPLHVVDKASNVGRCMTSKCFEYLFYIDFEASMADRQAQNALKELEELVSFLRVLGCYPMDIPAIS
ncbi:hypothetical protein O6H91_12G099300 [Diphasiastrum complanatum]|uniref:Uncharacterized protein n=1 Tax=Diphasiastrum complanatum TaxID=34168 RepID=A0ACC2C5A3_DIPCM|nr:hypothetical protein O6H91_12G099300 [Diphasiastrum complanatum]